MKKLFCLIIILFSLNAQAQVAQNKVNAQLEAISTPNNFQLTSPNFQNQEIIPQQFVCQQQGGQNAIPLLNWQNAPLGTQSFAILVTDPDAPDGTWTHWLLYNIPATANSLSAMPVNNSATSKNTSFITGKNSYGNTSYQGPCPPAGKVHHYIFTLYALNQMLPTQPLQTATSFQFLLNQGTLVIAQTQLVGLYQHS